MKIQVIYNFLLTEIRDLAKHWHIYLSEDVSDIKFWTFPKMFHEQTLAKILKQNISSVMSLHTDILQNLAHV